MSLRFGVHSGQQHTDYAGYAEIWRTAEELGLEWASVFDHFLPIQADPAGPCFESLSLLAAMAAQTERLRCGVIVLGVTYRHPAVLAKMAATIDHVSGGRLELGLGAAWYELEHEQYGIPFPPIGERMDMLDEACRICRSLWTNETTTFDGEHWQLREARCEPKPVQERLPLWIGGSGERRTLRIVAEHADGWNTFLIDEAAYRHKLDVLAGHCADVGRDPAEIRKQLVFSAILGEDAEDRLRERASERGVPPAELARSVIVGSAAECVERLRPFLALGVEDFLVLARPPLDRLTFEVLAREVAPAMRG